MDGLEDELAGELWMAARDSEVDPDWENAPPYWQRVFKLYARTTIRVMSHNHG